MRENPNDFLRFPAINGWQLFWLITAPISLLMISRTLAADLSSGDKVSSMIQLSVRCAVPLLFITFAASAIQRLFPGPYGRWLLRNRKYLGLSFAAAMAWQGFFILWLVIGYTDYYVNQVYVLRDAIEGVIGYAFLAAMTFTSFPVGRRLLKPARWRLLHVSGIYFLWAYAFSVYWWALFYYGNPALIDYIYYWAGLSAWLLRVAAWSKKRLAKADHNEAGLRQNPLVRMAGFALIGAGFAVASFGNTWQELAAERLYGHSLTSIPERLMPYWPFEPFLPLGVILAGAWLLSMSEKITHPGKGSVSGGSVAG